MALYNQNYQAKLLNAGSIYTTNDLGDGLSASCVHQIFCLSGGTINISALGGGNFNFSATTNSSIDVIVGNCQVLSGSFVGFKSKHVPGNSSNNFYA